MVLTDIFHNSDARVTGTDKKTNKLAILGAERASTHIIDVNFIFLAGKWFQQQMPACRPVFTAVSTFVGFVIIGIAFLIIGSVCTAFSSRVRESHNH